MDFLIELLLDLVLEGSIEVSSNRKMPKIIRYPLIAFITLFYTAVISILFVFGISIYQANSVASIVIVSITLLLLVTGVLSFRKRYLERKGK